MHTIRHIFLFCCYAALGVSTAFNLPQWVPGVSFDLGALAGVAIFAMGALLHEVSVRATRDAQVADRLGQLQYAHEALNEELTWTRREVKAVREALEAAAQGGRIAQGASVIDEVVSEVKMLKSLVSTISAADAMVTSAGDAGPFLGAGPVVPALRGGQPGNPMKQPAARKPIADAAVLKAVQEALRDDRIEIALQPIVSLPQRKLRFYEVFTRLKTRDGTELVPDQYIGLAEKAGLVASIDNMLLFRCIQVVRRFQRRTQEGRSQEVSFFCNISSHTLGDSQFFGDFVNFLEKNAEIAPNLVFEFAQGDLSRHGAAESRHLDRLAAIGSRFSLDQVRDLNINPLKLARRQIKFIKLDAARLLAMHKSKRAADLMQLKAKLDEQHIDMIVEKVEDEQHVIELLDYNIDFGQGYLFGAPKTLREDA